MFLDLFWPNIGRYKVFLLKNVLEFIIDGFFVMSKEYMFKFN